MCGMLNGDENYADNVGNCPIGSLMFCLQLMMMWSSTFSIEHTPVTQLKLFKHF